MHPAGHECKVTGHSVSPNRADALCRCYCLPGVRWSFCGVRFSWDRPSCRQGPSGAGLFRKSSEILDWGNNNAHLSLEEPAYTVAAQGAVSAQGESVYECLRTINQGQVLRLVLGTSRGILSGALSLKGRQAGEQTMWMELKTSHKRHVERYGGGTRRESAVLYREHRR